MTRKGLIFTALGFILLSAVFEIRIQAVERRMDESEKVETALCKTIHKIVTTVFQPEFKYENH